MATFLITGAARGIGAELARQALAAGHEVIGTVRQVLPDVGDGMTLISGVDMTKLETIARIGDALNGRPIDVLINNAGIIGPKRQSTLDMDFAGFEETLLVNAVAPLRVTQAVLPNLRAARDQNGIAKIATISSAMGQLSRPSSSQIAYRASKAAVNKVMQGLAADLKREQIAVAILHPGWVRTDMGGGGADIAVEDSAAGILSVVDRLTMKTSGKFVNYDGQALEW
jgi:short-subunit dehydrogenase